MSKDDITTKVLKDWQEFEDWLKEYWHPSYPTRKFLFRGQSDSSWKLESSLERYCQKEQSLYDYYGILVKEAKPLVETYNGTTWSMDDVEKYEEWIINANDPTSKTSLLIPSGYDFFIYLRHHGFPSPLLDWTSSPYIAAFFAFREPEKTEEGRAIYVYEPSPAHLSRNIFEKTFFHRRPKVDLIGPYIKSHKRHFQQQTEYTMCTRIEDEKNVKTAFYASHEEGFVNRIRDDNNEHVWKLVLPKTERVKVLQHLDHYNINAYSLFQSEESLCEALAFKVFSRHGWLDS